MNCKTVSQSIPNLHFFLHCCTRTHTDLNCVIILVIVHFRSYSYGISCTFPSIVVFWYPDLKFPCLNLIVDNFVCKTADMQAVCVFKHISYFDRMWINMLNLIRLFWRPDILNVTSTAFSLKRGIDSFLHAEMKKLHWYNNNNNNMCMATLHKGDNDDDDDDDNDDNELWRVRLSSRSLVLKVKLFLPVCLYVCSNWLRLEFNLYM